MVRRAPAQLGYAQSRWRLSLLLAACPWLRLTSEGGLSQLLKRLHISYKRGRDYVHSPDPDYLAKVAYIAQARQQAETAPEEYTLLYLDEVTGYRQPEPARDYEARGHQQPLARRSHQSNTPTRVVATLNARTGQVLHRQRSHIDVTALTGFWYEVRAAYPTAKTIFIVLDNWPVHFHPDVLAPLQPQQQPWPIYRPAHWITTPTAHAKHDDLPIQLLPLPTYASWLNPIEKLWRWLRQDVLYLHRWSHDWQALKQAITDFLDRFRAGSQPLLRYVGLLPY